VILGVTIVAVSAFRARSSVRDDAKPVSLHHPIGITETTIKVVLYLPLENDPINKIVSNFLAPSDDNAKVEATVRGFVRYFEATNYLFGRHVELVPFTATGDLLDSVAARADALTIAEQIKPFMVWGGPLGGSDFADELAARGVMCIQCVIDGTNSFYSSHAPYVWSLQPSPEQVAEQVAEYVRKRLAGSPAVFAGSARLRVSTRRFGLIYLNGQYGGSGLGTTIDDRMREAGVAPTVVEGYDDPFSIKEIQTTLIAKLRHAGVTTVVYGGDPLALQSLMAEATVQRWYPEWMMTGTFTSERSTWGREYDPTQMKHAFGITPLPVPTPPSQDIVTALYRSVNHTDPPARESDLQYFAPEFLFYTAARAAGPDLNARSFQQALFRSPGIVAPPGNPTIPTITYGYKGYWPGADYAGIDDFTEIWWDPTAIGPDENGVVGKGMWAFSDDGRRYLPGHWPVGPPKAFVRAGAVTLWTAG